MPLAVVAVTLVALLALTDAADSPPSLAMFCLVAFVLAAVGQELWRGTAARRTMTGESWPRALARLTGRNRRRYGGYLVHAGHRGAVPGRGGVVGVPGPARRAALARATRSAVNGYEVTYREATAKLGGDSRRHRRADLVRRGARRAQGRQALRAAPVAQLLRRAATPRSARSRASSRARPPARSTCAGACTRDLWLAVRPDIGVARAADPRGGRASSPTRPATCRR